MIDLCARASRVESRADDGARAHREFALTEYSVSRDARKRANGATDAVDGFVRINHGLYVEISLFARVGLALTNAFYWVLAWKLLRSTGEARAKRSEARRRRRAVGNVARNVRLTAVRGTCVIRNV